MFMIYLKINEENNKWFILTDIKLIGGK